MADWHYLHLTFEPPATDEQLLQIRRKLKDLDYDAPTDRIGKNGTLGGSFSETFDGDTATRWRSPFHDMTNNDIAAILTAAGISGRGWMRQDYRCCNSHPLTIHDNDRFVFGAIPEPVMSALQGYRELEDYHKKLFLQLMKDA